MKAKPLTDDSKEVENSGNRLAFEVRDETATKFRGSFILEDREVASCCEGDESQSLALKLAKEIILQEATSQKDSLKKTDEKDVNGSTEKLICGIGLMQNEVHCT